MSKIEQNREKKKQAILVAAKEVFLSEGYTSASMDVIAAKASITKQTLYRYFPSKIELFQNTLQRIGESYDESFSRHLKMEDTRDAMIAFAIEFVEFHTSSENISTQRLLITEASQAPELVESFMQVGPNGIHSLLKAFFAERFDTENPDTMIELWLGMLHAPSFDALMGMPKQSSEQLENHAKSATDLILASVQIKG